jgi:large subunit ribosomal protein L22
MSVSAKIRYLRITPRKVRAVANQIRGMNASKAVDYLTFCKRRAARPLLKMVKSALANADQKGDMDLDNLVVAKLLVDQGPTFKRWLPRARGMATPILRRTSHVTVELEER